MNRYFQSTPYPLQLVAEMPTPVEGVLVITSRGQDEVLHLADRLRATSLPAALHEVIIVLYDSDHDEDHIARQNTDHFWALTNAFSTDSHVHVLLWHHLPEEKAALAAIRIGMDEAAKRLEDAGSRNGWMLHLPADVIWEGDLLWTTHEHFSGRASSSLLTYPMQSLRVSHSSYLNELAYRYHREGFAFASLPMSTPFMALRQSAYLMSNGWPLCADKMGDWQHELCQLEQPAITGAIRLMADFEKVAYWSDQRWVDPYAFPEAQTWLNLLPALYRVKELRGYGEWLKTMSAPIAAGLQELGFFTCWRDQLLCCSNEQQFFDTFRYWLTPDRARKLVLSASGMYAQEPPQHAAARLLEIMNGYPPERHDIVYLLDRFRKLEEKYWMKRYKKEKAG